MGQNLPSEGKQRRSRRLHQCTLASIRRNARPIFSGKVDFGELLYSGRVWTFHNLALPQVPHEMGGESLRDHCAVFQDSHETPYRGWGEQLSSVGALSFSAFLFFYSEVAPMLLFYAQY